MKIIQSGIEITMELGCNIVGRTCVDINKDGLKNV